MNRKISIGYFINKIKGQIVLVSAFALIIGLLDCLPVFQKTMIPLSVPTLVGTAVVIILTFRTAQSYERWWEARAVWGAIVNDSRTFIRQLIQCIPNRDRDTIKDFADRQIIWAYALGEALRLRGFSPRVLAYLKIYRISSVNIPNALLEAHSTEIKQLAGNGVISDIQQVQLNETLARLCDSMDKSERIKNTVFPRSYSILVHTLIYVFAAILPFGLEESQLGVEMVITILIPVLFIAIEKTAILMQDPFENTPVDLPVTSLAETIEINIRQMTQDENIPAKTESDSYFEM
ncbi:bestrophin family protein [Niabella beijingensis]|uniref:bestrophin family protein n=1 Tax=Niabella beijingensis TaxID=2872700 RepID=UPI001CBD5273|nr:bestrophin family ion channel [Niabella beijingensis]MBZ4188912.1 hypothetical protein [Niabella beijingensis]